MRYVDGSGNVLYLRRALRRARDELSLRLRPSAPGPRRPLYYYAWRTRSANDDRFATALLRRDGSKRPTYDVVASRLARLLPGVAGTPPPASAGRKPPPFELLDRRLRLTRRGLLVGPLRCPSTSKPAAEVDSRCA